MIDELILDHIRSHYYGKYRGTVIDNADPTSRGRLQVSVPSVLGAVNLWAMPCVPYAGVKVGFYSLPAVGTGVWVEFEAGDPSYPVWTGFFWGDGELPDAATGPDVKVWKTDKHILKMDDAGDQLQIGNDSGSLTTYAQDVKTESGGATVTVGSAGVAAEMTPHKVEVTQTSVSVNSGALEVM